MDKLSNEEITSAFIQKNEELAQIESLDKNSKLIVLKYKLEELKNLIDLILNEKSSL